MYRIAVGFLLFGCVSVAAQAKEIVIDTDKAYVGGGLNRNTASGESSGGFQILVGYPLEMVKIEQVTSFIEIGYMDAGKFCGPCDHVSGMWGTYLGSYAIDSKLDVFGRAGLDLGDDDGLMFGIGAGYRLTDPRLVLRAEYVVRDHVNSLQLNVAYALK